ncbi:MAG TPA: hypothetical protein VHH35_04425 [Pyrinomonadaceae bacterium]|nr:hypothetical protein [Pyrinomonadaceae bacterium]
MGSGRSNAPEGGASAVRVGGVSVFGSGTSTRPRPGGRFRTGAWIGSSFDVELGG